jgi:hypothetical protein
MGKLVASGLLDEAEQIGLAAQETARTIQSGLAAGRARPRDIGQSSGID